MRPLFVDYETRGVSDLKLVGHYEYITHPQTEILMVGKGEEGRPLWTDDQIGETVRPIISWGPFDRIVYEWVEKHRPAEWIDAQALALYCGLPKSLEGFCRSVGIEAKKDAQGTKLINLFCRPREDGSFREMDEENRAKMEAYCLQDVRLLMMAWDVLSPLYAEWKKTQGPNYSIVARMNENSIPIDRDAVESAMVFIQAQEINLTYEFKGLTGGVSPFQSKQLAEWFGAPDVRRETLEALKFEDPAKEKAREIRLQLSNATVKKLKPMLEASLLTGRVRGAFVCNGAHTGRCTSHLVQFQNMKRSKTDPDYFDRITKGMDTPNPMSDAQSNIRGFIYPGAARTLVVADYSQVEARVLAWMSGDETMLDLFRSGADPYKRFASMIFGVPVEEVTDHQRQLGKIDILGSGFGVGGKGLARQAIPYGVDLSERRAWKLVNLYRETFKAVPEMWSQFESGLSWLMRGVVESFEVGRCEFTLSKSRQALLVTLPSGRRLRYMFPQLKDGLVEYTTRHNSNTARRRLWGGHMTENLCQAIAADLKFDAMRCFPTSLIAEVHDEIILEVEEEDGEKVLRTVLDVMEDPPAWFTERDLIKASGSLMKRYSK